MRKVDINSSVRLKEIIAEVFPSDNAVNSEDAKILIPLNKKQKEKILNPCTANVCTVVPGATKIDTMGTASRNESDVTIADEISTNHRLILSVFCKSNLRFAPN